MSGEFKYDRGSLIAVISQVSASTITMSTVDSMLQSITNEKITLDYNNHGYIVIDCPIVDSTLAWEKIEELKDIVSNILSELKEFEEDLRSVGVGIQRIDSQFADELRNSDIRLATTLFDMYQNNATIDALAYYEFIKKNITKENYKDLNLTAEEKELFEEFLKYGSDKQEYLEMSTARKRFEDAKVVLFSFVNGVLNFAEDIIDGAVTIVGICTSPLVAGLHTLIEGSNYIDNIKEQISNSKEFVKYEFFNSVYDAVVDYGLVNSHVAYGKVRQGGLICGELTAELVLTVTIPATMAAKNTLISLQRAEKISKLVKGAHLVGKVGQSAQSASKNEEITEADYISTIALGTSVDILYSKLISPTVSAKTSSIGQAIFESESIPSIVEVPMAYAVVAGGNAAVGASKSMVKGAANSLILGTDIDIDVGQTIIDSLYSGITGSLNYLADVNNFNANDHNLIAKVGSVLATANKFKLFSAFEKIYKANNKS